MTTNGDNGTVDANGANDDPFETMMIHWSFNGSNGDNSFDGNTGDYNFNGDCGNANIGANGDNGNIGANGDNYDIKETMMKDW